MKKRVGDDPSSLDAGWVPWTSRWAPHLTLAVNEEDREIRIVEDGAERRLNAEDTVSFALELADVERYYAAEPAIGDRDSSAILAKPAAAQDSSRSHAAPAELASRPAADAVRPSNTSNGGLVRAVCEALTPSRVAFEEVAAPAIVGVCVVAAVVGYVALPLMANSDARGAWLSWAREHGSPELRHTLPEFDRHDDPLLLGELQPEMADVRQRFQELLRADVAVAITPPVDGAARCLSSVRVETPVDFPAAAAERVLARIRHSVSATTLPRAAQITVGRVNECSFADSAEPGLCVPVALKHGDFSVATSYCLAR